MLVELTLRDFAIVEDLRLEFSSGLNILTGETGAGKSILVDALGVVLGDRVHADMIRTGADEARVGAVFDGCDGNWAAFLEERGIDPGEGTLVVQRRIGRNGRHQAWVNGTAVPVGVLGETGARLVDIHGQHQHQTLLRQASHLEVLDDQAGLTEPRERFAGLFGEAAELTVLMARSASDRREREARREFTAFALREIEAAGLEPGEDAELERDKALMANAEQINLLAGEARELLYDGEHAAAGAIEAAAARVRSLARHIPEAAPLAEDLAGSAAVVREASGTLADLARRAEYDPERHNQVEERLALIGRLKRKYGETLDGVLSRGEELRGEARGGEWEHRRAALLVEMATLGEELSAARSKAARGLEKDIAASLRELSMDKARFVVRLTPALDPSGEVVTPRGRFSPTGRGLEEAEFLFSANPGEDPKPLARIASGGELSRIMLAVKTSMARVDRVMTLIFDEIDTGIGGAVARVVGRKLKQLSADRQVIGVTHLPQIASLAEAHFVVSKAVEGGRTRVGARRLGDGERVGEVARMIAGERVTEAARRHARELMEG
jgi:DNA repair protein RecN (Recombination protein N)